MMRESLLQDLSLWGCLWQSMAFIALGLVAGYLLRRRPSRAYQVLLFAMLAAAIVPLMSAVVKHYDLGVFTARATESPYPLLEGPMAILFDGGSEVSVKTNPPAAQPAEINSGLAELTSTRFSISLRAVAVYGWMIVTLALLVRLIVTFMYGAYIVRNAQRSGCEQVQQAVDDVTLNLGLTCGLQVRGSRRIRSPIVWCWSRPSILLVPNSCRDPRIDWAGVVAHELAHCKRWDHITGLMAESMVCLLPWNPLMWLSKKCLVRLSEQACDDWVIATGQPSEDYAESLLRFRPQRQMAFLPAVVHSKKGLASRVDRILKDSCGNPRTGTKWALATSFVTLSLTVGVALAQTRPAEPANTEAQEKPPAKSLYEAVEEGDVEEVKRLIAKGADVNAADQEHKDKVTPLCVAAEEGHAEIVKTLLEHGAKVDANDSHGYTPLFYAIWSEDEQTVRNLISADANVNAEPKDNASPLYYAIWQDHAGIVRALLGAGARAEPEDFRGWSPLQFALEQGNPGIVTLLANTDDKVPVLHKAALRGDLSGLKELLGKGADLNEKDGFDRTPVYYALAAGQGDAAKFLLDQGADINLKTRVGRTLLHQASRAGLLEIVQILLARDMPADTVSAPGHTPLHEAAGAGHKEIAELLISKGAPVDSKDKGNPTPLHMAAAMGETDIVELLIAKGANIKASDSRGRTPLSLARRSNHTEVVNILRQHGATETLHGAVASGDIDEVKRLLSQGGDINAKNESGQTPLHLALNSSRMEVAELLVANGADVEAIDDQTGKALLLSVGRRKERVEFLLSKGANIEAKDGNGLTLLQLMAAYSNQKDYLDIVKLLLEKGADIETRGYGDTTPLQTVVAVGRKEAAELLLAHGAKVDVISRHWGTPAHHAMQENHPDLVRWCIARGVEIPPMHQAAYFGEIDKVRSLLSERADINQKDIAKFTPLHCAVFGRNKEIVQLLLENGADVEARSCAYATPLFWSCRGGYLDMVKLLVDNGAEVNDRALRRMTWGPTLIDNYSNLHIAAHRGHTDVIEYLLGKGADIHARCTRGDEGLTPLHMAARNGHVDAVRVLLAKGADTSLKSKGGRTALDLAKEKNHPDVVELLQNHGAKK